MLHIAICDDSLKELGTIAEYTKEYIVTSQVDAEIRQFCHPDELLAVCRQERFNVYILDIVMPMINGIEIGKVIRHIDWEAQIIYVTTEPSFALEAFSANPINYLLKPVDKLKLFETLAIASSKVDTGEESIITVKTKEGIRVLKLSAIVYCEYAGHAVVFTLVSGEKVFTVSTRIPFREFTEPLIQDKRFLQSHNSFVLNMNYVESFSRDGFVLRGNAIIPIAKSQYIEVRNLYMDYMFAKEVAK